MITDLDEFVLFMQDSGDYQALKAVARFRLLSPEARERLRAKWRLQKRIKPKDDE